MSRKYKFRDNSKPYFVTFTITNWIDLFVRNEYKDIVLKSINYCCAYKDMEIYSWCIMPSHVHLIMGSKVNSLSNIMRDLKRHSSEMLHLAIQKHPGESRREWLLWMMERAGRQHGKSFQLWQAENHPQELNNASIAHQKKDYIHNNPVTAGFVVRPEDWLYSSARDYNGSKGMLDIIQLDAMVV